MLTMDITDQIVEEFNMGKINKSIQVPIICIYIKPKDYPEKIVARLWDGSNQKPTNIVVMADTVEEIEQMKPDGMIAIPRLPSDDPVIREVWI